MRLRSLINQVPGDVNLRDAARLLPDLLRCMKCLATDRRVPRHVRFVLPALAVYLVSPIDVIPDFLPVVGHVDDVMLVLGALRYFMRNAGEDVVRSCWPGTDDGLATIMRLVHKR